MSLESIVFMESMVMERDKDMENKDMENKDTENKDIKKLAEHLVGHVRDARLKGKKKLSDNQPEAETVKE